MRNNGHVNGFGPIYTLKALENRLVRQGYPREEVWRRLKEVKCLADGGNFRHNRKTQVVAVVVSGRAGFIRPRQVASLSQRKPGHPKPDVRVLTLSDNRLTKLYDDLMWGVPRNAEANNRLAYVHPVPQLAIH